MLYICLEINKLLRKTVMLFHNKMIFLSLKKNAIYIKGNFDKNIYPTL